jgi:hypothetical protein
MGIERQTERADEHLRMLHDEMFAEEAFTAKPTEESKEGGQQQEDAAVGDESGLDEAARASAMRRAVGERLRGGSRRGSSRAYGSRGL